jgi:pyruvate/2-oxoglutarate/acetoin dehydrogenase E1 component
MCTQVPELTYREAINRALADELASDDSVFLLGEDVAVSGGVFKVTDGLFERFGECRVLDTPISEQAIVGTAIGAAVLGLRPVAEIMFADFAGVCFDQIANQASKYRYMTGGQVSLPLTIRLSNGASGGFGAQHSQAVENWFLNFPGLKVVTASSPRDAYGLLRAAIRDPNPVLYFEHKSLYNTKGEVPDGFQVHLGVADIVRPGADCTVVATQLMRHRAVEAAEQLAADGIEVEVIDPRTLVPLDLGTIAESVGRTHRLVCVQESSVFGSWAASVVAEVARHSFEYLDAPPTIVGGPDSPIPFAATLEVAWLPTTQRIAEGIRATLAY